MAAERGTLQREGSIAAIIRQEALIIGEQGFRVKLGARIVVDTNLRCRVNPALNSDPSGPLQLGQQLTSQYTATEEVLVGNVRWYRMKGTHCWIYGPSTFLWNSSDHELVAFAILDRLTKKDVRFEDFIEAEKVMLNTFGWTFGWSERARQPSASLQDSSNARQRCIVQRHFQSRFPDLAESPRKPVEQCSGAKPERRDRTTRGILEAVSSQQERALGGRRRMGRLIVGAIFG